MMKTLTAILLLLPTLAFGQMDARDIWMNAQRSVGSRKMTPEELKQKEAREAAREATAIAPNPADCRLRSWGQPIYQAAPSKPSRPSHGATGQRPTKAKPPKLVKRESPPARLTKIYADGDCIITDGNGTETHLAKGRLTKLDAEYVQRIKAQTLAKREKQTGEIPPAFDNQGDPLK